MLNGLRDILGVADGGVHLTDAPSIPPLRASEIDGITFRALLDEYTIVQEHRVHTPALLNLLNLWTTHHLKAFATREGKDGYNRTQCQE